MAKPINDQRITAELIRARYVYDPETGIFTNRVTLSPGAKKGERAGFVDTAGKYRNIGIKKRQYAAHRLAWVYIYGSWPERDIDHINGNGLDNRISNLREATTSQNGYNQRTPKNNTSGIKGLTFDKKLNKWVARVEAVKIGCNRYLGMYASRDEAIAAIHAARRQRHGEFSNYG